MNILFIGAGKMATAIAAGIVRNQLFPAECICACDPSLEARQAFNAVTGLKTLECADEATTAATDVLILAVKPQHAAEAVAALPKLKDDVLIFSICAGITIQRLQGWFGEHTRIVRVMPNTPLMSGQGASCYALSHQDDQAAADFAQSVLGAPGKAWRVPEEQLDAVTALSGSGPAYFFAFIEALRAGGEKLGLDGELAEALAIQTMAGAAAMLQEGRGTPAQLRAAVTSKGGTTAAALQVMADRDFAGMVADLMQAAADRSAQLGRGE